MFFTWMANDVLVSNLYPAHEVITLAMGQLNKWEEKFVRKQQYNHLMAHRSPKYDFLELGVLEKFPYPRVVAPEGSPNNS